MLAFIPKPLQIENRPELSSFPVNILFVSLFDKDGKHYSAQALYEPVMDSFKKDANTMKMEYKNKYGGSSLVIQYDAGNKAYSGDKYLKEENVSHAFGDDWKTFFSNMTMTGLSEGEQCYIEEVELPLE